MRTKVSDKLRWYSYKKVISDYCGLNVYEAGEMNYIDSLNWLSLRHQTTK